MSPATCGPRLEQLTGQRDELTGHRTALAEQVATAASYTRPRGATTPRPRTGAHAVRMRSKVVERSGIEPLASSMPSKRSTN